MDLPFPSSSGSLASGFPLHVCQGLSAVVPRLQVCHVDMSLDLMMLIPILRNESTDPVVSMLVAAVVWVSSVEV